MKFNLIFSETSRSAEYLNALVKNKLIPFKIIYYSKKRNISLIKKFKNLSINYKYFPTNNINDLKIRNEIVNSKIRKFIYSGYPGEIVKKQIIDRKNLIHCHPGRLPKFKGSTVIYYSLILTGKIFCSCIKLNSKIDEGKILIIKRFKKPKKIKTIEGKFDNKIRSMTLIAYLKSKKRKYKFSYSNKTLNYYIAHPIIRSIILNKSQLNFLKN